MRRLALLLCLALLVPACGTSTPGDVAEAAPSGERLVVLAADEPIADLVRTVAGARAEVSHLVPLGVDVRDYEPAADVADRLRAADVFFEHGRGLNEALAIVAVQEVGPDVLHVPLGETVNDPELVYGDVVDHGDHTHQYDANPRLMSDPTYAIRYVRSIRAHLTRLDPDNEVAYRRNADALIADIEALHAAVQEGIASIPEAQRMLLVVNDGSWAYFARRYRMAIASAHLPADLDQPTSDELALLYHDLEHAEVPAFFGPDPIPDALARTVHDETGATYVHGTATHALPGEPGDPEHGYVGMMAAAAAAIVEGLGGDASGIRAVLEGR